MEDKYPKTKDIIYLLGMGAFITAGIVIPGALYVAKLVSDIKEENDRKKWQREWKKFNLYALKRNLKRLHQQKVIEFVKQNGEEVIKLTHEGRTRYLKLQLQELSQKGGKWDGKWRIVIYDISKFKRNQQSSFRNFLKSMNFLLLQRSVYITPYPCEEHITYMREYFGIGEDVILVEANKIENEQFYKDYFGL